jgi:hypothetical protein
MNWEAIRTISEVVGALAVVLSLVYVGVQIRQNTRQVKVATHDGTTRDFRQFTRQMLASGLTQVFARGLEDHASLSEEQKLEFAFMMYDVFKAFENVHYHYLHGTLGEDAWAGWRRFIASYASAPGAQHYWGVRKDIFTQDFQRFVEELEPADDFKRVGHVFDAA